VALSAVAVIVHPSNPIAKRGLTLPTLRAIFAQIQSPGDSTIRNWGDLGVLGILNTHRRRR
jgi:ABC-type phosphate transport system substrate-binding protein